MVRGKRVEHLESEAETAERRLKRSQRGENPRSVKRVQSRKDGLTAWQERGFLGNLPDGGCPKSKASRSKSTFHRDGRNGSQASLKTVEQEKKRPQVGQNGHLSGGKRVVAGRNGCLGGKSAIISQNSAGVGSNGCKAPMKCRKPSKRGRTPKTRMESERRQNPEKQGSFLEMVPK